MALLNKIKIPAFPSPYDADGKSYIQHNLHTKKIIMDEEYYIKLLAYGHNVEAAAQALEELK